MSSQLDDETLVDSRQARDFFGRRSQMWIERREKGDPTFPRARRIANRKYWLLGELRRWRDAQPRFRVIDNDQPQRVPPPRPRKQHISTES